MAQAPKSLRGVNLNLLPVLRALLRETSVSRAARSLGLSQSATSACLAQLRLTLSDPLLVKVGRSMRLTDRAEVLIVPLEQLCAGLENLLHPVSFCPRQAERSFVVATPDYVGYLLGAALIRTLADDAPHVAVRFIDVPPDLQNRLASGDIDIAIVATDMLQWTGFSAGAMVEDTLVVVAGRHHPLADAESISVEDIAPYSRTGWHPGLDRERGMLSASVGSGWVPQLQTQQFAILPLLALESDSLALAPRSLAERMATILPLKIFAPPFRTLPIRAAVIWSPVHDTDPAHVWFRDLTGQALCAIGSATKPAHSPLA